MFILDCVTFSATLKPKKMVSCHHVRPWLLLAFLSSYNEDELEAKSVSLHTNKLRQKTRGGKIERTQ